MYSVEINKRRTFAIISHPDAGKTTLTEKLLLFGGAIQTAGAVKSNKIKKSTASDFMEIERQRGISVATSVMNFTYNGMIINLLDTPGHKDFAEDVYRTLTAVDSVIIVVDCVKGVEEQTEKLMEVCRMRKTPVIVFINKLDREGKRPFDILDEIESKLRIKVRPLSWPISMGSSFKGVYNLYDKSLNLFRPSRTAIAEEVLSVKGLEDSLLDEQLDDFAAQLREDVALIEGVYEPFELQRYLEGELAPDQGPLLHLLAPEDGVQRREELVRLVALGHEIIRAALQAQDFLAPMPGEEDDGHAGQGRQGTELLADLHAALVRKDEVEEDAVGRRLGRLLDARVAGHGVGEVRIARLLEPKGDELDPHHLVFDHQNAVAVHQRKSLISW